MPTTKIPSTQWEQEHHKKFTLSAYSAHPVNLERLGEPDLALLERNMLKSFAVKNPTSRVKDYGANGEPEIKRYMGSDHNLVYFYYNNQGTKTLKETVTLTNRANLRICAPFKNNNTFEVVVPPGSDAVVIYKAVFLDSYSFGIKSAFSLSYDLLSQVMKGGYTDTTYHDDPNDVFNEVIDTDCYNQFIKDDRDAFEIKEEAKVDAPEAEEEEVDRELVGAVLREVKGQLHEEDTTYHQDPAHHCTQNHNDVQVNVEANAGQQR